MEVNGLVIEDGIVKECHSDTENLVIPEGVREIGENAFGMFDTIGTIELPSSMEKLGNWAHEQCQFTNAVKYGGTVDEWNIKLCGFQNGIPESATVECSDGVARPIDRSMTKFSIPDGITAIGDCAFYGCKSLSSVEIPESVRTIGEWAFGNCESLALIELPKNITSIKKKAFKDCKALTSIKIPSNITKIEEDTFMSCESLSKVELPSSIRSIGIRAFQGCQALASIEIPHTVAEIGDYAFRNCSIETLEHPCLKIENGLAIEDGKILYCARKNKDVVIPNGVKEIPCQEFFLCDYIESVEIPSSMEVIGDAAFSCCESIKSVKYDGTVNDWNLKLCGFQNGIPESAEVKCTDGIARPFDRNI